MKGTAMNYLSPGVYVEEVPSAEKPIAGVGTSTAGFIGVIPDSVAIPGAAVTGEVVGTGDGTRTIFDLKKYPVVTTAGKFAVRVAGTAVTGVTLTNVRATSKANLTFATAPAASAEIVIDYSMGASFAPVAAATPVLCTNFSQFTKAFGDFSSDDGQRRLAHAVYGFFNNGGTRCYVIRETSIGAIATSALGKLAAIDEIAIVAAPGITDAGARSAIIQHCEVATKDRFAILDGPATVTAFTPTALSPPANTTYGAFYFPWLKVADPVTKLANPTGDGLLAVPPSGHIAGIYARVDTQRGVHKAPANEVVFGAVDLSYAISKADQNGLNPTGINCIRDLNGNIRVWGARTIGGDANADFKYINVRRLFLFLRESIDEGTQWAVFEPNSPQLWQKIKRNITAFLTNVWRDGALFGDTAKDAFYVKCDEETNPPETRALGQVITEVGVAVVRPAEFVVFRLGQWSKPSN